MESPRLGCSRARALLAGCLAIPILAITGAAAALPSQLILNLETGLSQHVVTYGTSLTARGGWTDQLYLALEANYPGLVQLTNSGIGGSASQNTNPKLDGLGHLDERVLALDPDTVFLEFAINDAFLAYHITLSQSRSNLEAMIDGILSDRSDREIILMTMNPAWDPPGGDLPGSRRPALEAYYQGYRDVAAERGLLLIDHYPNWIDLRDSDRTLFEQYLPDGLHPTFEAMERIITPEILHGLTVPEPGTALLLGCGLAACGLVRRGRRARAS